MKPLKLILRAIIFGPYLITWTLLGWITDDMDLAKLTLEVIIGKKP